MNTQTIRTLLFDLVRPLALTTAMALFPAVALGNGIFDDNDTPLKSAESPRGNSPAPSPATPSATPTAPELTPQRQSGNVAPSTPVGSGAARGAAPDSASRAKCRKLFQEVYATELKDHSSAARHKLAQTLFDQATKAEEGSADRFVLLTGTIQAAEEGQDVPLCFEAAKQLADGYNVDELSLKIDAMTKAFSTRPAAGTINSETLDALGALTNQIVEDDRFAAVPKTELALERATQSAPDAASRNEMKTFVHDLTAYRDARQKIAPAIERLKSSTDDPAANLAVGRFFCFQRGRWVEGLPLLAKSSDATLRELASLELSGAAGEDAKISLADKWFANVPKLPSPDRPSAMQHAADLYRAAEKGVTGLQKLAIEKRLSQIPRAPGPHRVNLLTLFDPTSGIVKENWRLEGGSLVCDPSAFASVKFDYTPPDEYDFRVSFTVIKAGEGISEMLYVGHHPFSFTLGGWANTVAGFDDVNGVGANANSTTKHAKQWLVSGHHYTSLIKVRKAGLEVGLEAYLDGQLISRLSTDFTNMGRNKSWQFPDDSPTGIGASWDAIHFDSIQIVEIGEKRGVPSH